VAPRGKVGDPGREAWAIIAELFFGTEMTTRFHAACERIGVTPPALKALLSLDPAEPKPMRALACEWHCDASWVTSLVDSLEEAGLVSRQILPADRRVKTIVLTKKGVSAKSKALDVLNEPPARLMELSRKDQEALCDLLGRLSRAGAGE